MFFSKFKSGLCLSVGTLFLYLTVEAQVTNDSKAIPIDAQVIPFLKTYEGLEYLRVHKHLPHYRDANGYPPPVNAYSDPELLKKLDWNAEDFRKFADRWQEAKEQAKSDPTKRAELEETLRNLGLGGTGRKINRLKDRNDGIRGMQEEGGRLRPPESLREQFEAFRKAAGKLGK